MSSRLSPTVRRRRWSEFAHPCSIQPRVDFVRVESEQVTELDVRDASFGDKPSHISHVHPEPVGGGRQVDERWPRLSCLHAVTSAMKFPDLESTFAGSHAVYLGPTPFIARRYGQPNRRQMVSSTKPGPAITRSP